MKQLKPINLDDNYSTTRTLFKGKPLIELEIEKRENAGGLRTRGFYKKSLSMKPLITIITVVFNGEQYLEETILSVLNQYYDNVEYIIIDGGSTDNTLQIIKKYSGMIDYWISEPDKGMYDAIIKGFSLCRGEIIAYINADDFYLSHAFSTVVNILEKFEDIKWITGMPLIYNELGQIISVDHPWGYKKTYIKQGLYSNRKLGFIQQESTFWRKELLNYVNYEELKSYNFAGDYYLWKMFAQHVELFLVESCFAGFRSHEKQLTNSIAMYMKEFNQIKDRGTWFWICRVIIIKILKLIPTKLKYKYCSKLVYYENEKKMWIKNV